MNNEIIDLPDIIEFSDFGGNYEAYEDELLGVYEADLWKGGLTFNGLNVVPKVHKRFELNGKTLDYTFVHFTSRGDIEDDRELDLRRCERICWIKPIIENAHLDCVKIFENSRKDRNNRSIKSVVIWYEEENIKIVITKKNGKRSDYYAITTFYLVNAPHQIKKINDEYQDYINKNGKFNLNN